MSAMRKHTIAALILLASAGVVAQMTTVRMLLHREIGTQLFWNDHTHSLLVLIGLRTNRWSVSGVSYAWGYVMAALGVPMSSDEEIDSVLLYHWNGRELREEVISDTHMSWYMLSGGAPYGVKGRGAVRWTGEAFEPISRDEARVASAKAISAPFTSVDGWSSRVNVLTIPPGSTQEHLTTAGRTGNLVVLASKSADGRSKAIDIILDGKSQRLWAIDETPLRFVSEEEYRVPRR